MSAFEEVCCGRPTNLAMAALEFARDEYADLDIRSYLQFLKSLQKRFIDRVTEKSEPEAVLCSLNDYFFGELEFTGNTENYYDPANSYLNDVLDRRMGIPISLSIVYRLLASSAGVNLDGINFPGHFLLAYQRPGGGRIYIDVFQCGQWLDWGDCQERIQESVGGDSVVHESDLIPMNDRQILVRMLRNLKGIYSRLDLSKCLRIQERLARLLPQDPNEASDLGILYFHAGKPLHAIQILERLVREHPEVGGRDVVAGYLNKAAREAVLLN